MVLVPDAMGFKLQMESKSGFRVRPRRDYRSEKAIRRTDWATRSRRSVLQYVCTVVRLTPEEIDRWSSCAILENR